MFEAGDRAGRPPDSALFLRFAARPWAVVQGGPAAVYGSDAIRPFDEYAAAALHRA